MQETFCFSRFLVMIPFEFPPSIIFSWLMLGNQSYNSKSDIFCDEGEDLSL